MEEAEGYRALVENYGMTQEQAAQRVGKSRSAVANALRLLDLEENLKVLVEDGNLSAGHARAILPSPPPYGSRRSRPLCSPASASGRRSSWSNGSRTAARRRRPMKWRIRSTRWITPRRPPSPSPRAGTGLSYFPGEEERKSRDRILRSGRSQRSAGGAGKAGKIGRSVHVKHFEKIMPHW